MNATMEDVLAQLRREEPDYSVAAALGPEVVEHLAVLARAPDVRLAVRAVYLASLFGSELSTSILERAAIEPLPELRLSAAGALRNVAGEQAHGVLRRLAKDEDEGVRAVARRSLELHRAVSVPPRLHRERRAAVERAVFSAERATMRAQEEAAEFAGSVARGDVIGISEVTLGEEHRVTVWYWRAEQQVAVAPRAHPRDVQVEERVHVERTPRRIDTDRP